MKLAVAVCFAALALVAAASVPSTTSKPIPVVTSSEPVKPTISNPVVATDESPVPEQPTTTSTSANKKDDVPIPQPLKANILHRVPVYVNRNPVVETISNLAQEHQPAKNNKLNDSQVEAELEKEEVVKLPDIPWHEDADKKEDVEQNNKTNKVELPIPSRCPQITGTDNGETSTLADLIHSSGPKAAQRGCRFYIMHELIDRNQRQEIWATLTIQQQINQTLDKCFNSCSHAYDNGTELNEACADGCRKTSLVTEAISQFAIPKLDELESEHEHEHDDSVQSQQQVPSPQQPHRTFSIFIPIRPSSPIFDKDDESETESRPFGSSFPIAIPDAVKQMLAMFQQASQSMMQSSHQSPQQPTAGGGRSNIQESELSVDSMGNSISISRSMSVMMTKDQDGHSKVVVVHTIPKVLVHRFSPNGGDMANQALPPPMPSLEDLLPEPARGGAHSSDGNSNLDQDDDNDDLFGDNDQFRFKLYGHLSNRGHNGLEEDDSASKTSASSQTHVYYYRTRLCYYLPRLLYLVALIMLMYVILWLLCAMPHMLGLGSRRAAAGEAGGASPNGGLAVIANNSKCRKFLFSKSQKYFQLNNKQQRSNSTTSLPPPYPGNSEDCESCATEYDQAGPLPEKQPIPSDESVKTTSK